MEKSSVVGIFSDPWSHFRDQPQYIGKNPWKIYQRSTFNKSNPRTEKYMKALFLERWPDGLYVNAEGDTKWHYQIEDSVVLLYPDSIGLGFEKIEKRILHTKSESTSIYVLNGRKRKFLWNHSTRRDLRIRRFLERSILPEILFILPFFIITLIFLCIDLIRGRR